MISFTSEKMQNILLVLRKNLRDKKFSSSKFPLFVFICGEQILDDKNNIKTPDELRQGKNKRQFILDKISQINNRKIVGVIAETLIETFRDHDSLTFEGILADISDEIIIIVESVGTFCELGAFSFSQDLVNKLYVLNDEKHRDDKSFINRGPIRKISDSRSGESKYIVYDTDQWDKDAELQKHFESWRKRRVSYHVPELSDDGKTYCVRVKDFVYEVINIISIFQPITMDEFLIVYKYLRGPFRIKDSQNKVKQVRTVFDMLKQLQLIREVEHFYCTDLKQCCDNYMFKLADGETQDIHTHIMNEYFENDSERTEVLKK